MKQTSNDNGARMRFAVLAALDASVLCLVGPQPKRLAHLSAHPASAMAQLGPDRVIALGAIAGLWLAAAWIGLGLLAAVGSALPGSTGRVCTAVAGITMPSAVRRVVIGAIGVGMLAGPVTAAVAGPATAGPTRGGPATVVSSRSLDSAVPHPGPSWPTTSSPTTDTPGGSTPGTSTPGTSTTTPPMTPRSGRQVHRTRSGEDIRVRAGDSLWLIAAHRLGGGTSPGHVDDYWRQVYAANRSVIGADPGLIFAGQVLHLPDPHSS